MSYQTNKKVFPKLVDAFLNKIIIKIIMIFSSSAVKRNVYAYIIIVNQDDSSRINHFFDILLGCFPSPNFILFLLINWILLFIQAQLNLCIYFVDKINKKVVRFYIGEERAQQIV